MGIILLFTKLRTTQNAFIRLNDDDSYTIVVNSDKPDEVQRESILHELSHIIHDDFAIDLHADIIERMAHNRTVSQEDLQFVRFYTRVL